MQPEKVTARAPMSGDHAAMPYRSLPELVGKLVPFIREGIAAGDLVLYICDDHTPEEICRAFVDASAEIAAAVDAGQVAISSTRETFFPHGRFNVEASLESFASGLRAAVELGRPRIRAVCELTYLLADVPGIERAGEFEARANEELFGVFPFICVCPLNLQRDPGGMWEAVQRSHPSLYLDGLIHPSPAFVAAN